jgi:hypothetical protein
MTRETTTAQTSRAREQSLAAVARATAMESDLGETEETARGLLVRQLTVDNPK